MCSSFAKIGRIRHARQQPRPNGSGQGSLAFLLKGAYLDPLSTLFDADSLATLISDRRSFPSFPQRGGQPHWATAAELVKKPLPPRPGT
jgi:hypothetical protein